MNAKDLLAEMRDSIASTRVFGEPYAKNGVTVIPVEEVWAGGGGGGGTDGAQEGSGAGFGVMARPVGVFVVKGDDVEFKPAVDVNRAILGGQLVAIALLLTVRAIVRYRTRRPASRRST